MTTTVPARVDPVSPATPRDARPRLYARGLLVLIVLVSAGAATLAMRRTSTTFDEIIMMSAGARGFELGRFDLQPEHPRVGQYLYGLPVFLANPNYPDEPERIPSHMGYRYRYSKLLLWRSGNDAERLVFLGRLPGVLCAVLLMLATWRFTRPWGEGTAVLAAGLVAFLPDVLAHAGVAYNDVPLTLCYLLTLWATDHALRQPSVRTGAFAGASFGLAFAIKFSAIGLIPAIGLLTLCEAARRRLDRAWLRPAAVMFASAIIASYLLLVASYQGELDLYEFRRGLSFTFLHVNDGHGVPAYLLGSTSKTGWWYFYPLAFFYKTPAALHALMALGIVGFARQRPDWRSALGSRLRVPIVGALVFGAALLTSSLNIGFRYALPMMPLLCILVAVGVMRLWSVARKPLRFAVVALLLWYAGATLSHYPYFLSYISEYGPRDGRGDRVLLDSSYDWGQGLIALREFMQSNNIDNIYLSYFGSAYPDGYGIRYVPLPSYYELSELEPAAPREPEWTVVSATNLYGLYLKDDPFRQLRGRTPDAIIAGGSLLAYRCAPSDTDCRPLP